MGDLPGGEPTYQLGMNQSPVEYVPQRVVSLVPSITETLFDLDLGQRIVAITDYCTRPSEGVAPLPRVGGTKTPDIARIIALQPDLVIVNTDENRREDADALRAAGLPLWVTEPRSIFDTLNLFWQAMAIFDHAVMVPRVKEIERAYDYTLSAAQTTPPVRVFVPIWHDPWITINRATYVHDVLRVCGGDNVFAGHNDRYPRLTLDEIAAAQPDVILLPDEPFTFSERETAALRALAIPAVRTGRIHPIDGSLLTWFGTRVAYAMRDLPALLMQESQAP